MTAALSNREHQVIRLVSGGLQNKDIARHLGVSVHTVETQLHSIYKKLGARDRAHAVRRCFECGIDLGILVPTAKLVVNDTGERLTP